MARPDKKRQHKGQGDLKEAQSAADRGRNALKQGDLDTAVRELTRAWKGLRSDPVRGDLLEASHKHGIALLEAGDPGAATAHLVRAFRLDPDVPGLARLVGRLAWTDGDLEVASAALGKLLEQSPASPWTLHALALVRAQQGNPAAALTLLGKAAPADPAEPQTEDGHAVDAQERALVRLSIHAALPDPDSLRNTFASRSALGPVRAFLYTLSSRHQSLARWFSDEVSKATTKVLETARTTLSTSLAEQGPAQVSTPSVVEDLRAVLAPIVAELEQRAQQSLAQKPSTLVESWEAATARLIDQLLTWCADRPDLAARVPLPDGGPDGLAATLDVVSHVIGQAGGEALRRLLAAGAPPPARVVWTLLTEALSGRSPGELPLDAVRGVASRWSDLPATLTERLAEALLLGNEPAEALALFDTVAEPSHRHRIGRALALELTGKPEEAVPYWQPLVGRELDVASAGGAVAPWLEPAVLRLIRHYEATDERIEQERLLRQASAHLPGCFELHLRRIEWCMERDTERELKRVIEQFVKSGCGCVDDQLRIAEALVERNEHRQAFELLSGLLKSAEPPARARALMDRVIRWRTATAHAPREVLSILAEISQVRPLTARELWREADARDQTDRGGDDIRRRAVEVARGDRTDRTWIGISLLHDKREAWRREGAALLKELSTFDDLPEPNLAAIVAGLMAHGERSLGLRLLEERLAVLQDGDKVSVLALLARELAGHVPEAQELARELDPLIERASGWKPEDPALLRALDTFRARRYAREVEQGGEDDDLAKALSLLHEHHDAHPPTWDSPAPEQPGEDSSVKSRLVSAEQAPLAFAPRMLVESGEPAARSRPPREVLLECLWRLTGHRLVLEMPHRP
ncbi:MAG: hypothetical protein HY815_18250 [Candidatus Riflebacteria bacterium]|nr:hypothetical protein [Candidatus Riflebacteria bacterium]